MDRIVRILIMAFLVILTSCGGTDSNAAVTDDAVPPADTAQLNEPPTAEPPSQPTAPTAEPIAEPTVDPLLEGGYGTTVQATSAPDAATVVVNATATATSTALPATTPTGWRYRDPDVAGQLFHFAGVRCGTPADLSGEWVITDTQIVEGVPIVAQYKITVDINQRAGTWLYEQSFEDGDVKNVGGFAGSINQIVVDAAGSVVFTLDVGTPIEGKLYTPDGVFAWGDTLPVNTLDGMTWDPIYGACP